MQLGRIGLLATAVLITGAAAGPASAQGLFGGLTGRVPLTVTPYGGAAFFTDFATFSVVNEDAAGEFRIRGHRHGLGGLNVGWPVGDVDLRLNAALAPTTYMLRVPGGENFRFGGLRVWMTDVQAAWRFWERGQTLRPYALLGAGAVLYETHHRRGFDDVEAGTGVTFQVPGTRARVAGTVGLGLDAMFQDWFGVRFEVANHISDNPLRARDFTIDDNDLVVNVDTRSVVHNVRAMIGANMAIGAERPLAFEPLGLPAPPEQFLVDRYLPLDEADEGRRVLVHGRVEGRPTATGFFVTTVEGATILVRHAETPAPPIRTGLELSLVGTVEPLPADELHEIRTAAALPTVPALVTTGYVNVERDGLVLLTR